MFDPAKAALEILDASRRRTGRTLEAVGLGPRPTPSTVLGVAPGVRLRTYPSARAGAPPVLLVPAPIKRSYVWDLEPAVSVVAHAVRRGLAPYLVEWIEQPEDSAAGLDHHADTLLTACLDAVTASTGARRIAVAGHSLGGTLAAICAARRPDRVAALALLEAPLRFGPAAGSFAPLVAAIPAAALALLARGGVPGAFLDVASAAADPREFTVEPRLDLLRSLADPATLRTHLRVLRWASDEFRMPGALFLDVVERLYRDDEFARGILTVNGERVGPARMCAPLTTVFAPSSAVIPPGSVIPVHEAAAAADALLLEYRGDVGVALQHVGVLVGRSAHRHLWPRVLQRLGAPA